MDYLNYSRSVKSDLRIIDDYVPKGEFQKIFEILMRRTMYWHFDNIVDHVDDGKFQFTHLFFNNDGIVSPFWKDIIPIFKPLSAQSLYRVKANLNVRTKNHEEGQFHYDNPIAGPILKDGTPIGYTAIYYVNTNNGYTLFKSGEKVNSVANRMVIFENDKLHKAVSCTDEKTRVVINFNYFTTEYGSTNQLEKTIKLFNETNA
tara:strand:+ start:578 stop:1186 length:609 start_codon:yes stop_codon:yes gene_type:complete